jgi:hypothetical protein
MAITVRCRCGKKTLVADTLAGATICCSACGNDVTVGTPGAGPQSPAAAAKFKAETERKKAAAAGPGLSVNPALLIGGIVGVLLVVTVIVFCLGPVRVNGQWSDMHRRANTEVTDTIDFALRAYESQNHMHDTSQSHNLPMIEGEAAFFPPGMPFSMPATIPFTGHTNRGAYKGTWNTSTGEIIAEIETGGINVAGLADIKKATDSFHITGREKNGVVSAECDGQDLKVIVTKH